MVIDPMSELHHQVADELIALRIRTLICEGMDPNKAWAKAEQEYADARREQCAAEAITEQKEGGGK